MNLTRHDLRTPLAAASAAALALALVACGSSSSTSTTPSTTTGTGVVASGGTPLNITLKDFSVTLAGSQSLKPGTYAITVTNDGPSSHNLTVDGPGVAAQSTGTFPSGQKRTLTVTLANGAYTFFCSLHKSAGMTLPVTVGSGGTSGGTTTPPASSGGGSSSGGAWA